MTIKWRNRLVLFKRETEYAVDSGPVGANAFEMVDVEITALAGDVEDLELTRPYLGANPGIPVNTHVAIEGGCLLTGAGAAGSVPGYGLLLEICGHAETVDAGVDVQYDPISDGEASATQYFYVGPNLHAGLGTRGAITAISLPRNGLPRINVALTSLFVGPVDATPPTPDFSAFQKPLPVSAANTSLTLTFPGPVVYDGPVESVELEYGQEVEHRDLINLKQVLITDRQVSGTLVIEAPDVDDLDLYALRQAGTTAAMAIQHGTAAGAIVKIDAPAVQIIDAPYAESGGIAMAELAVRLLPTAAGNDEIKITVE